MTEARKCDACGSLVEVLDTVRLVEVERPTEIAPSGTVTSTAWGDVDICSGCLGRPMGQVLKQGCDGLTLLRFQVERDEEASE
jgi:hypothetical protein